MSWEEVRLKSPSRQYDLTIRERKSDDINFNGGNDFKIESVNDSVNKKVIKKEIWAVSDGENLFINGIHYDCQIWYAKAEHIGRIILFKGAVSSQEAMNAGVLGGAIGGAIIAPKRYVYRLGKNSGRIQKVDKEDIENDLAQHPDLLAQYKAEKKPKNSDTILKYAIIINSL